MPSQLIERLASMVMRQPSQAPTGVKAGPALLRQNSIPYSFLEHQLRNAVVTYLRDKDVKEGGHPKGTKTFNQFWLQLPKLHEGFTVLSRYMELHTGRKAAPVPLKDLLEHADFFGLREDSPTLAYICSQAAAHKCPETDVVGLAMVMLIVHLTDPQHSAGLDPDVRLMLNCLEAAFSHFQSARNGKLDKREVTEAMQQESAKAHVKEGKEGRTSTRLAAKLFDGLEWSRDNTVTFEQFLRGVVKLLKDEFEEDREPDPLLDSFNAARASLSGTQPASRTSIMGILRKSNSGEGL